MEEENRCRRDIYIYIVCVKGISESHSSSGTPGATTPRNHPHPIVECDSEHYAHERDEATIGGMSRESVI